MLAQFSILALDALLLATLIYLFVLMRKLKVLHSHRDDMRSIISDVIVATESSRDAVARLKSAVIESQSSMANYFEDARKIQNEFDKKITDSKIILKQIESWNSTAKVSRKIRRDERPEQPGNGIHDDVAEFQKSALLTSFRSEQGRTHETDQDALNDREIQRRLTSLNESVNTLRSKIMAYS